MITTENAPVAVDFWFDPVCPWTWLTSRWLTEVSELRPLDIRWRVMSLAVLNAGRDLPPEYVELLARAWGPVRVLTAVRETQGQEFVGPLYTEIGERIHRQGIGDYDAVLRASLAALDLPPELADAAGSDEWDEALRAEHGEAMTLVGEDVGSPVIRLPEVPGSVAYFGPVINPAPHGDDALRLWDGIVALASTPQLHELKRTRNGDPVIE